MSKLESPENGVGSAAEGKGGHGLIDENNEESDATLTMSTDFDPEAAEETKRKNSVLFPAQGKATRKMSFPEPLVTRYTYTLVLEHPSLSKMSILYTRPPQKQQRWA
jgi:hypothetical protein